MTFRNPNAAFRAKIVLDKLTDYGLTIPEIARRLGNRVSEKTLRRWRNAKSSPVNSQNITHLERLLSRVEKERLKQ